MTAVEIFVLFPDVLQCFFSVQGCYQDILDDILVFYSNTSQPMLNFGSYIFCACFFLRSDIIMTNKHAPQIPLL